MRKNGGRTATGYKWETICVAIKNAFIVIKDTLRKTMHLENVGLVIWN